MKNIFYITCLISLVFLASCKNQKISLSGLDLPIANTTWEDKVNNSSFESKSKMVFKENTCEMIFSNIFSKEVKKFTFTQNGSDIFLTPDYENPQIKGVIVSIANENMIYSIIVHLDGRHSEGFPSYRVNKKE